MKRRIIHSDENDAFTAWRKYYAYLKKPGATSWIKNRAIRRERREGRDQANNWRKEYE